MSHSASKGPPKHTNALAKETSPYLLQHAHNPVNWYPWGPEAFEKARKEDKPVFLSIGYSSCHWCHVMERESFEKEDAAEILNKHFISIKVDREERPDVDEIYMTAVQLVSGHGGWPMSVFMTSEGKPFFAGTYFPPEDRHGRMGFKSLLKKVNEVWGNQRADVLKDANHLSESVQQRLGRGRIPADGQLNAALLDNFVNEMHESFDVKYGGFGTRPKFPPNNGLPLLLHLQQQKKTDNKILQMTRVTLEQMALGGIHDHLGGGFHRYSTDQFWLLPHFEKMLYDNAMLSRSYALASVVYNEPEYARIARGVYDWVLREMTSPDGGFYSTLDADSEGHEGKFYVWDKKEIDQLLGADAAAFNAIFNIHEKGNFREEATGEDTGLNIPHMTEALENHAKRLKLTEDELRGKINGWKATLLAVRIKRVWPGLDDKILTAWNALMISSFARGSIWLNEPRYKAAAVAAAEFALKNQRTKDGRWLATHRKGESKLPAYLDDHAFLAVAFLDLFDATNDARWKEEAVAIVKLMDEHFADDQGGGYFFTADDHEKLLARTKDPVDKAIPSGNGWAAQALVRLAKLTGDQKYRDKAAELFEEFHGLMEKAPQATESLLLAFANHLEAGGAAPAKKPASTEAKAKVQKGPVIVELFAARSALRAGAETPIAVRLSVDEGWHIQAHGEKNLAETKIVLASDDLGTLKNEKYPDAKTLSAPELGGDLKVYEGAAIVSAQLAVPANAPLGKQTLKVKVKFQACNDKVCEKPEEAILSLSIDVVAKDADVTPTNGKIFDDLK